jgi:hypothetical protein
MTSLFAVMTSLIDVITSLIGVITSLRCNDFLIDVITSSMNVITSLIDLVDDSMMVTFCRGEITAGVAAKMKGSL